MQNKTTIKLVIDKYKLDVLFRLGCPDQQIIQVLKTGTFDSTGDKLIDSTLESLVDIKQFDNWGGKREGAGRPKNQVENQLDNQDDNQDVDKDKEINNILYNTRNNNTQLSTTRAKQFIPPTLEQVLAYAEQQNSVAGMGGFACTPQIAEEFWSNYASNGWVVGNDARTPVRDWKAKLRQWALREQKNTSKQTNRGNKAQDKLEAFKRSLA